MPTLRSLLAPRRAVERRIYIMPATVEGVAVENMDAVELYRTQPNLRAVVTFLADNAAQVPIKVHERRAEDDRPRVLDSPAALALKRPNPDMTPFEFKRWVYSDLLIFERCLVAVVPSADMESGFELRPIPGPWIGKFKGANPFSPEAIEVVNPLSGRGLELPRGMFVLFHGYNPADPMRQMSRISALKETLHEQVESNRFRRQMWRRGGRFNAYLTRPKDVERWSPEAFERFKETWKATWAGDDAGEAGGMPILEDGMEIRTVQFNSRDAQWADAVRLSREDAAAVYHVNPGMIWPGSGQTYASAKDNARALYNDALAPLLMQVTDRVTCDLMPMLGEPAGNYAAYDITIKTEGTFEEKISALQSATGAPFLSREEARAYLNLPAEPRGDLIVPLNVLVGGLASNHDTDPTVERYNAATPALKAPADIPAAALEPVRDEVPGMAMGGDAGPKAPERVVRKAKGDPAEGDAEELEAVYRKFFERQAKSVIPKIEANGKAARIVYKADGDPIWWNAERWNRELADDLWPVAVRQADAAGERTVAQLWPDDPTRSYGKEQTGKYIRRMCERRAETVNATTLKELQEAIEEEVGSAKAAGVEVKSLRDAVSKVFDNCALTRAGSLGAAFAAALSGFGSLEACRQNVQRGENVYKTWRTTSGNPRPSHRVLDGETVQYDLPFSNGMMWPGDYDGGGAAEVAFCKCVLEITKEEGTYNAATARSVVSALGIEGDYSPQDVYDAYMRCNATIGQTGEWADLSAAEKAAAVAEMKTRDTKWVTFGEVPKVTFATPEVERRLKGKRNRHELRTGERLSGHGVPSAFQVDERHYYDVQKRMWQRVGLADLGNGYELKTLRNAGWSSVDSYLRDIASKKEGVLAVVIDNYENKNPITDGKLIENLRKQRRWNGPLYLIKRNGDYIRVK